MEKVMKDLEENLEVNVEARFPENKPKIIRRITKKYGLDEDFLQKFAEGKITESRKITILLRKVKEGELKPKDFPYRLKEELNLSKTSAIEMSKELKNKILLKS